jgi:hypothetical protein
VYKTTSLERHPSGQGQWTQTSLLNKEILQKKKTVLFNDLLLIEHVLTTNMLTYA